MGGRSLRRETMASAGLGRGTLERMQAQESNEPAAPVNSGRWVTDCDEVPGPEVGLLAPPSGGAAADGKRVAGVERRNGFVRREKL
jgi:hypothetical protein